MRQIIFLSLLLLPLLIFRVSLAHVNEDPKMEGMIHCMEEGGQTPQTMQACMNQFFPGLFGCLISAVGQERFSAISSGAQPTAEEMEKGMNCFTQLGFEPPPVTTSPNDPVQAQVEACMRNVLGDARIDAMIAQGGGTFNYEESQKIQACFSQTTPGPIPPEMTPPPQMQLDSATTACLKSAVGETRFNAISSGQATPTEAEMQAGQNCFGEKPTNAITPDAVLPPDPTAVPYLPEEPETVTVEEATPTQSEVTVEGTAEPNTAVDLYVYSEDPTVVRVKADAKGKYTYTFKDLEEGDHLVYATAKSEGESVRSKEKKFVVGQAAPLPTGTSGILLAAVIVGAGLTSLLLYLWKKPSAPKPPQNLTP